MYSVLWATKETWRTG